MSDRIKRKVKAAPDELEEDVEETPEEEAPSEDVEEEDFSDEDLGDDEDFEEDFDDEDFSDEDFEDFDDKDIDLGEEENTEPWGAQVLRRIHDDNSVLMKEYDEMLGPLENTPIEKFLQKKLGAIAKEMDELEKLWGTQEKYKDLSPLSKDVDMDDDLEEDPLDDEDLDDEPVEDDVPEDMDNTEEEMDDVEVPAESGDDDEEVSAEDAIEGMEKGKKSFYRKPSRNRVKSLRAKYNKAYRKKMQEEENSGFKSDEDFDVPEEGMEIEVDPETEMMEKAISHLKQLSLMKNLDEDTRMESFHLGRLMESGEGEDEKSFTPRKKRCSETSKYLKAIAYKMEFGEQDRSVAYHLAKAMEEDLESVEEPEPMEEELSEEDMMEMKSLNIGDSIEIIDGEDRGRSGLIDIVGRSDDSKAIHVKLYEGRGRQSAWFGPHQVKKKKRIKTKDLEQTILQQSKMIEEFHNSVNSLN